MATRTTHEARTAFKLRIEVFHRQLVVACGTKRIDALDAAVRLAARKNRHVAPHRCLIDFQLGREITPKHSR
jgi:hypothetical protein